MQSGDPPLINAELRELMKVLGKAETEFISSLTAPLYWVIEDGKNEFHARNGSAFFLDAGTGVFGVTACHVVNGWQEDSASKKVVALQLGSDGLQLDFQKRNAIIAADSDIDIATFRISPAEVATIGKTILTGYQSEWPPPPPEIDRGVYFAGFPGVETLWPSPHEISFGIVGAGGVASSVQEDYIASLIERENLIPVLGQGIPPENYDFGGISGGPMLSVIEHRGLRSWALAGVIFEGPNTEPDANRSIAGLEIIKARRAHFILPDGTLDIQRWNHWAGFTPRAHS